MNLNQHSNELNVLGTELKSCSCKPLTGWKRDGYCNFDPIDHGNHIVCCAITDSFLRYSKAQGNDLITPIPEYGFAGLKHGDKWCLCASRWKQAFDDGMPPKIILESTHSELLKFISLDIIKLHSYNYN